MKFVECDQLLKGKHVKIGEYIFVGTKINEKINTETTNLVISKEKEPA